MNRNAEGTTQTWGWLTRWGPALAWAFVIWTFSTGLFTAENTASIIIPLLHWLFPHASNSTLYHLHHFTRKCGHFFEYFVFSLLLLRAIRGEQRGARLAWALAAIALVFGWAALDEFHQSFVPGRTPAFRDVLLDTAGGSVAQAIAALLTLERKEEKRENVPTGKKAG